MTIRPKQIPGLFALLVSIGSCPSFAQVQPSRTPLIAPVAASAQTVVPALVPYTGLALDRDGRALVGETGITFMIYKDQTGGDPLFIETQRVVPDATGHYAVHLGASMSSGLPIDLFASGEARWLAVQIAGEPSQPRTLLTSVPYALKAADAATLGGLPASAFMLAQPLGAQSAASVSPAAITPNATSTVTTTGGTANYLPKFSGSSTVINSVIYDNGKDVGIGIVPNGNAKLDVNGPMIMRGNMTVSRTGNATTAKGYPSYGFDFYSNVYRSSDKVSLNPFFQLQSEPTGNNTANIGSTLNFLYSVGGGTPGETGLYINPNGTIHFASGQAFTGSSNSGYGIYGQANASSGSAAGVYGYSSNAVPGVKGASASGDGGDFYGGGSGYGILAVGGSSSSGVGYGGRFTGGAAIDGVAEGGVGIEGTGGNGADYASGTGVLGFGGYGDTANGGTGGVFNGGGSTDGYGGDGIYVSAGGSDAASSGVAGYFNGDVTLTGTLTAGAKNFRIDDPIDPANKYLNHTSIESSEMVNIYSGNVITNGQGVATVKLPSWFQSVNGDLRYQLTMIGQKGQAWISQEVNEGQFEISSDTANAKVSWQITGVRQDAYAKAHPLVVEQAKDPSERGFYQNPELFGQPAQKQTQWGRRPNIMRAIQQKVNANNRPKSVSVSGGKPATAN